jgi:serine/threonine-protein kinase
VTDADLLAELQSSLGAAYTFDRELGGGGMARVFLAHERGLGRPVVIKILNPELAEGINADRFEREIRLAASLQQANIVPLLSAGRAARHAYYTMPFVEGRSLQDRLARDSVLPIAEGVSLLRDVARALAYAHERGVVHRDIKPGNVLLSGGTAVVTDFGIAKALTAARGDGALETLTQAGISIGTPAYMAPEQAAGDPSTDHRADIYAFGCLAYEVFSGKPPFDGEAPHRVIAAHFAETPRPITERRAELSPTIAALIAQCLEKDPGRRPQSAAEVLQSLDVTSISQPVAVPRRPPAFVAIGALAITALVAGAAYLGFHSRATGEAVPPEPLAFAAIPFQNVARDTALEYRADGIRDEILNGMSGVPGIQIVARNAARRYKNLDTLDEGMVERQLGARFLVTGTYRQNGGRIFVSAQLSDSVTRGELWSASFERGLTDFGSLPGEISQTITATLRARYRGRFGDAKRGTRLAGTTNPAALEKYLIGQEQLRRRGSGVKLAVSSFEEAIRLDPKFARAHAALAAALMFVPFYYGVPVEEVKARVTIAAQQALELDSTLADAHTAMATLYASTGQWEKAFAESKRAIEVEPDNFEAHVAYGRNSVRVGRLADALDHFARAKELEPVSPLLSAWTSYALYLGGQTDSAWKGIEQAMSLDSTLAPVINNGSLVSLATGHDDVARRLMAVALPVGLMSNQPYVMAKLGDTTTALRLVSAMESSNPRPWFTDAERASVRLAIGDSAGALNALEQSARSSGGLWEGMISPADAAYDPVRHTARFAALLRQAGLDVQTFNALRSKRPR